MAWGSWLRDTEPLHDKAEMTAVGGALFRAGRATRRHAFDASKYIGASAFLSIFSSHRSWIPSTIEPLAQSASTASGLALVAGFGALCVAKAAKIAIQARGTYSDALALGVGRAGAAKRYGTRLALEAKARAPDVHRSAANGSAFLGWVAHKIGLQRVSLAFAAFEQSSSDRSAALNAWRAGSARQAVFMDSREQHSADCYRDALRLAVAERLGHFDLGPAKSLAPISEPRDKLFSRLAAGFDRSFPTWGEGSDPAAKINSKQTPRLSFASFLQRSLQRANANQALPSYSPAPAMPTLSEVFGVLALRAAQDPTVDFGSNHFWTTSGQAVERDSLARQWAPWRSSLESQEINQGLPPPAPCASSRRANRI